VILMGIDSGKANLVLNQRPFGSWKAQLIRKQVEYEWAASEIERGTPFVKILPVIWSVAKSKDRLREAKARVKRIWETKGFLTQEDRTRGLLNALFLGALPFGLYNDKDNVDFLNRDFIVHDKAAVKILPIQADYSGSSDDPTALFVSRKGQIIPFSAFTKRATSYNGMITASTGKGKSVLMNYLVHNDYKSGVALRIIDI
ncbi:MAG: conjugal transfer protein TraC, partial [bacterium]|nr:conjugal transfer protein TraC [bacterium]